MCFPPLCSGLRRRQYGASIWVEATRPRMPGLLASFQGRFGEVLGCLGLKQGANGVLVLNSLYGLCLVIVHALLLGEVDKVTLKET